MELPAEVAAAYDALQRARHAERAERERRIGRTYMLLGAVLLAILLLGALALRGPAWPVGAILVVLVLAWLLQRRWLRHMKVDERSFTGLPPGGVAVLLILSFLVSPIMRWIGFPYDGWSIHVALWGSGVLLGGLRRKDRLHALLGLGMIGSGVALLLVAPSSERAAAISALALGGALLGLGLIRYHTPETPP